MNLIAEIEGYQVFNNGILRNLNHQDKPLIDLKKLIPVTIGMRKDAELNKWMVDIITKPALYKYREKITKNLEVLSFSFSDIKNAVILHNALVRLYYEILVDAADSKEEQS